MKKPVVRTCIACRQEKEKKQMLRIVRDKDGNIKLDFTGKASGRGAYICDDPACIAKLRKGRLLNRAFSCEVSAEVYAKIEEDFIAKKQG